MTHTTSTTLLVNLAAPASLMATSGSTGQITLSWSASAAATTYHLKRALVSGGPYVNVVCTTATTYTDTALTNGTTYYYVVSAAYQAGPEGGGESADSSEASGTSLVSRANLEQDEDEQSRQMPGFFLPAIAST
jgi:fibronectin type 3 domain-containing protein